LANDRIGVGTLDLDGGGLLGHALSLWP
jgi:hypothetical protein